ncbi:MAG: hypothetical protein DWH91_01895 [Planctomycetota bacterium]|nr:MAG: hypothetical protein DWH91_01895 [Planctomycetota bacterium]
MSSANYRRLLTNLPSMAAVVNSFQSEEVQLAVYRVLVDSLLEATADEPSASAIRSSRSRSRPNEIEHELVEGDNIHSIAAD